MSEKCYNAHLHFICCIMLRAIRKSEGLSSDEKKVLDYALAAWDKALFSMDSEISVDGWLLGPHGELLFWVPEGRRQSLWRPCLMHISAKNITRLNFDSFVHGSRWTECKGNP